MKSSQNAALYAALGCVAVLWTTGCPEDKSNEGDDTGVEDTSDAGSDVDLSALESWSARFDVNGDDFFRMPWPHDYRRADDGSPILSDYPQIQEPLITKYTRVIEQSMNGFSTSPVVYFQMNADPADEAFIPAPADTRSADASVQLIDVSADSDCSERVPVLVDFDVEGDGLYALETTIRVTPVEGFALRPGGTYAAVLLDTFGFESGYRLDAPGGLVDALAGTHSDGALNDAYEPLAACLDGAGLSAEQIAMATVFSVDNPIPELETLHDFVISDAIDDPEVIEFAFNEEYVDEGDFVSYQGTYETPIFMEGDSPYTNVGGSFVFDDGGVPVVQRWEEVPFLISVPEGEGPFPILVWMDGTGWSEWGHVFDRQIRSMLEAGVAVASFMPQFHGSRATIGSNAESSTYNVGNPEAGRSVLRQEMLDVAYFVRLLRGDLLNQAELPELDADRLVYGGHSQGTQAGSMLAAFSSEFDAFVLNGIASYMSITIVERKDILDFEAFVMGVLGIDRDLDRFHPVIQMIQMGADAADNHNYAPLWSGWEGNPSGNHVFVINGLEDGTTHPIGMTFLTVAADSAPIEPAGWNVDPYDVWDREPEALPIQGNREAYDGSPLTHASWLDAETGHGTIYQRRAPRDMAIFFWLDALDGGVPSLTAQ